MSKFQKEEQKSKSQVKRLIDKEGEKKLFTTIEEKCKKSESDEIGSIKVPLNQDPPRWEDLLANAINHKGSTACVAVINDSNSKELIIIDEKCYLQDDEKFDSVRTFLDRLQNENTEKDDLKKSLLDICKDAIKFDDVMDDESEKMIRAGVISEKVNFENLDDCHQKLSKYVEEGTTEGGKKRYEGAAKDLKRKIKSYINGRDIKTQRILNQLYDQRHQLKGYTVAVHQSWDDPYVHSDVKAIEYLREAGKLKKEQVYYIGLALPPCITCDISIRAINKENEGKGQVAARQTDGRYFPSWSRFAHLKDNVLYLRNSKDIYC